jgi:DNA-binding Lrp family transcriptional regulator
MQTIFIHMKCALGEAYAVADELVQTVEQVSEVYSTSGHYDLLVKCYLDDDRCGGSTGCPRLGRGG